MAFKKGFFILLVLLLLASLSFFIFFNYFGLVKIKNRFFLVELAKDRKEMEAGLSGRKKICKNCGMLFLFKKNGQYSFWMKDMKFDLDIVWIKGDRIVSFEKNIPSNYSFIISPKIDADKVLELNGGSCDELELSLGDKIEIF